MNPWTSRRYPDYEDSEDEMIGVLPADWETKQVRRVLKDGRDGIRIGPFGSALKLEDLAEDGICVYGQENVIERSFSLGKRYIAEERFLELETYEAKAGDLLITMMGTSGKCTIVPKDARKGIIDSHLLRLRVRPEAVLPEYFRLLLDECHEIAAQIAVAGKGSIMHGLNSAIVKSLALPLPSAKEQESILKFLDYETAKIDALIEKQQQLIALLKEKRQAVITQAATKGVEAGASLKDSGINWMGSVPAHWKILPVKRLFDVSYGLMGEIDRSLESGTQVISLPNVLKDGTLDLRGTSFRVLTVEERKAAALKKGDLLFNWRNGSIDHVGKTALFDHDGDYAHVSFLLKLRALSRDVVPEFYWLALNGLRASGFFGSSKLQVNVTYNQSELRRVPLPVPPVDEQRRIVDVVLKRYKAIDAARALVECALELLQERRTALISAAVTGKIDVRNWKAPKPEMEAEVA